MPVGFTTKGTSEALIDLQQLEGVMADKIKVDPSPNRSTIHGIVLPGADGNFLFTLDASTAGNGQGQPMLKEMQILLNGEIIGNLDPQQWENGPANFELTAAEQLKGEKIYSIYGYFKDENANAQGIKLSIERA